MPKKPAFTATSAPEDKSVAEPENTVVEQTTSSDKSAADAPEEQTAPQDTPAQDTAPEPTEEQQAALAADLEQEIQNQTTAAPEQSEPAADLPAQETPDAQAPAETQVNDQVNPDTPAESPDQSTVVKGEPVVDSTPAQDVPAAETPQDEGVSAEEKEAAANVAVGTEDASIVEETPVLLAPVDGAVPTHLEDGSGFQIETNQGLVEVKPLELPVEPPSIAEGNKMLYDEIVSELDRLLKDVDLVKRVPFEQIKQYLADMSPGQMVEVDIGKRHQKALFGALGQILNATDDNGSYNKCLTALLKVFDLAKDGALHETHVYRFMDMIELREEQIKSFQRWLNLLMTTANVKSRAQTLRQIDFDKALQYGLSEQARTRIRSFYNL